MTTQERAPGLWSRLPVTLRAILAGLAVGLIAANVWLVLLLNLSRVNRGVVLAAIAETIFLAFYVWWASGGGPPRATQAARARAFRRGRLSSRQWLWGPDRGVLLRRDRPCLHRRPVPFDPVSHGGVPGL